MTGLWEENEVKDLFNAVEKCKKSNRPIKEAFIFHAEKYARKANSVRNYYYHEIDILQKDKMRQDLLNIDLNKHNKTNIVYFSKEEEALLMEKIDEMTAKGLSVRKACLNLAEGDVNLLLRYQNKYRNYLIKKKGERKESGNIIAFKKPPKSLSDSEVQSLFMGLVRLVKKNATIEGEERFKEKLDEANNKLRKALADLQAQAFEIDRLKEKYSQLKRENNSLALRLVTLRCDKAAILKNNMKKSSAEKSC